MELQNNITSQKGHLALIGGAEDRKDDMIVLKRIVNINNSKTIIVIPSATSYPIECGDDYKEAFGKLGVEDVRVFDIRDANEADDKKYLETIEEADMVFFTGGDQVRLVNALKNTQLIEKIHHLYQTKGLTIAGTSAGAAAASDPMTYDGDNEGLIKGTIEFSRGFGFIQNVTIDTHFVARGRIGRLTQFLCSEMSDKGIGIGENTAIIVNPDNEIEVVGTGIVTVVNTSNVTYSNINKIQAGQRITIDGIKVGFLQHGAIFDLKNWNSIGNKADSEIIPHKPNGKRNCY
ncbi:MAG: cyanophycinase [Bacteroidota bacterium]